MSCQKSSISSGFNVDAYHLSFYVNFDKSIKETKSSNQNIFVQYISYEPIHDLKLKDYTKSGSHEIKLNLFGSSYLDKRVGNKYVYHFVIQINVDSNDSMKNEVIFISSLEFQINDIVVSQKDKEYQVGVFYYDSIDVYANPVTYSVQPDVYEKNGIFEHIFITAKENIIIRGVYLKEINIRLHENFDSSIYKNINVNVQKGSDFLFPVPLESKYSNYLLVSDYLIVKYSLEGSEDVIEIAVSGLEINNF